MSERSSGEAASPFRQVGLDEVDGVAATLADAFFHDPVWGWVFGDDELRREQHRAWFAIATHSSASRGAAWTTGDEHGAVAVWVPPGEPELIPEDVAVLEHTIRAICPVEAPLIFEVFELFEQHTPPGVYDYLSLLGTRSDHRGRGLGMDLLRHTLTHVDAARRPAYLESTNDANLARYQSVGFEPLSQFRLPDGPVVRTMWRPAQDA